MKHWENSLYHFKTRWEERVGFTITDSFVAYLIDQIELGLLEEAPELVSNRRGGCSLCYLFPVGDEIYGIVWNPDIYCFSTVFYVRCSVGYRAVYQETAC